MSSIVYTYNKNAKGQSVFDGPGEITHDADGLTPEERDSLPYPYNRHGPSMFPVSSYGTPTPIEFLPKAVHDIRELNLMYAELAKKKHQAAWDEIDQVDESVVKHDECIAKTDE